MTTYSFSTNESSEDSFTFTSSQPTHLNTTNSVTVNQTTTFTTYVSEQYTGESVYILDPTNAQLFLNGQSYRGYLLQNGLNSINIPAGTWYIGAVYSGSLSSGQTAMGFDEIDAVSLPGQVFIGNIPLAVGGNAGAWKSQGFTISGAPAMYIETEASAGKYMIMSNAQLQSFEASNANGYQGGSYSYTYALGGQSGGAATEIEGQLMLPAGSWNLVWINDSGGWAGGAANVFGYSGDSGSNLVTSQSPSNPGTVTPVATTQTNLTVTEAVNAYNSGTLGAGSTIADSSGNLINDLAQLNSLTSSGLISGIRLTDSAVPTLSLTAAQLSSDLSVINDISSSFNLSVAVSGSSATVTAPSGHGTIAVFTLPAADFNFAPVGNGIGLTLSLAPVTGQSATYQLNNVQALQFSDKTDIVAQTPATNSVTTGNITELYGAVFGREPDVSGLAYYENYAATNPTTPLIQYAKWFLASPEYTQAHNYAQSVAGDQQFVTDSYNNLLRRAPSATEVAFYENNVVAPALAGLTSGTSAYLAADNGAHAQTLVYFSASSEFLGDVQITAQHPGDAQHWLILI